MKKVLIPTDFSETARDAFIYAQSLLDGKAEMTVLHAYHPQVDPMYPYMANPSEGFFKEKEEFLNDWTKELITDKNEEACVDTATKVSTKLVVAGSPYAIVEKSKEVDLIVMGSTGESGILEIAFGSTATHVARFGECPVLLVPKGYTFKGYKKILYASNVEDNEELMLQKLVELVGDFKPEISLVHVEKNKEEDYEVVSENYKQFIQHKMHNLLIKYVEVESKETIKGLQHYANDNEIDLIVMTTKQRSWLEELFHKSVIKEMVLNAVVPIMVLHPEED
jgi:nucleotide-binding universal stress UspA family protein